MQASQEGTQSHQTTPAQHPTPPDMPTPAGLANLVPFEQLNSQFTWAVWRKLCAWPAFRRRVELSADTPRPGWREKTCTADFRNPGLVGDANHCGHHMGRTSRRYARDGAGLRCMHYRSWRNGRTLRGLRYLDPGGVGRSGGSSREPRLVRGSLRSVNCPKCQRRMTLVGQILRGQPGGSPGRPAAARDRTDRTDRAHSALSAGRGRDPGAPSLGQPGALRRKNPEKARADRAQRGNV